MEQASSALQTSSCDGSCMELIQLLTALAEAVSSVQRIS